MDDKVLVPPEPLFEPPIPWHPIPAIVKAKVEVVSTELNRKRRVDFIFLLFESADLGAAQQGPHIPKDVR